MRFINLNHIGNGISFKGNDIYITSEHHDLVLLSRSSLVVLDTVIVPCEVDLNTNDLIIRNYSFLVKNKGPVKVGLMDFERNITTENINSDNILTANYIYNSLNFSVANMGYSGILCLGGSLFYGKSLLNLGNKYKLILKDRSLEKKVRHNARHAHYPHALNGIGSTGFIKALFEMPNTFVISFEESGLIPSLNEKLVSQVPSSFLLKEKKANPVLVDGLGFPVQYRTLPSEDGTILITYEDIISTHYSSYKETLGVSKNFPHKKLVRNTEFSVYRFRL